MPVPPIQKQCEQALGGPDQVAAWVVMLSLSRATRIFVALQPTDRREGLNRLYAHVETRLNQDPWSGHPFVFTKRVTVFPCLLFS